MALFGPGVVIIPPDKETNVNPYVPGVIMSQVDGSVLGAVPNTVVGTSDGAVLADGTMFFNDHLTPFDLRAYDTDFNLLGSNVVFSPSGVRTSPPSPASDFAQWCYVQSVANAHQIRRMDKTGAVDGTTWTLTDLAAAFSPDPTNTWLYYFDGSGSIKSWLLGSDAAGPLVFDAANLPANYGTGATMRVVPGTGNILAMMNYINGGFVDSHLEVWQIAGLNSVTPAPGTVITKTVLKGKPGNTDPTMQVDVGFPNGVLWARSYDGDNDRQDGCLFDQIRLADGAILTEWRQTIAQVDGGVPGGILPATCPLVTWSFPFPPISQPVPQVGTEETRPLVRVRQVGLEAFPGNVAQFIGRAEVQMQPGLGVPADPTQAPVISMAWSGDNAVTFNTEQPLSLGQTGAYYTRAYKHVVGGGPDMRQPACKITCSDDVTFVPTDLFVTREPGTG